MKNAVSKHSTNNTPTISEIINRPPGDLKPWPNNPRRHSDNAVAKVEASIRKLGFTNPVLVDEASVTLAGHARVQAAKNLGLAAIPTRVISGLTEAEKRAYVIADNKLAQLSTWDSKLLKAELEILIQEDFDVSTIGFDVAEIDLTFGKGAEPAQSDPDDLQPADIAETIVSREGDLWSLGNHRLLCGNALEAQCYKAVMQDGLAQMVITDPPRGVPIDGPARGSSKVKHKESAMATGELSADRFAAYLSVSLSHMHAFAQEGAILFVFIDWPHLRELQDAAQSLFGPPCQLCVWIKDSGGSGSFYPNQHELVHVYKKGTARHINNVESVQHRRNRSNVWHHPSVSAFKGKGNELQALRLAIKPTSLIADAICDCSHRNGIVLDPFAGSGTILTAAERTGRLARAIELEPKCVDTAVLRWQRVTGKQAVLVATGQTWDHVRAERAFVER